MSAALITPDGSAKLRDFEPIEWGFLKFLGGVLYVLFLLAFSFVVTFRTEQWTRDVVGDVWSSIIGSVVFSVLVVPAVVFFTTDVRQEWIRSFFARNLRGYLARVFVPADPKLPRWYVEAVTGHGVLTSTPSFTMLGVITIELRLGGWISWGGTGIFDGGKPISNYHPLCNWRVRLHKILHTGAVLVRVEYTHPDADGKHESIELEAAEAVRLLEFVNQKGSISTSISDALIAYRNRWKVAQIAQAALSQAQQDVERLTGESAATKSAAEFNNTEVKRLAAEVQQLTDRLTDAASRLNTIKDAFQQIHGKFDSSQRLKSRIEALEIWVNLLHLIATIHEQEKSPDWSVWCFQRDLITQRLNAARAANARKR